MKYILVTGGLISGIGKGIVSGSIGTILHLFGLPITCIKIDPYLNIDAGTFSPYEHGEVYVLDDGGEVDLDLGNYERYLNIKLTKDNNITTGKVYLDVIQKERDGDFLGKTVQVIPHITDAILKRVKDVAKHPVEPSGRVPEVCIIELGGTIGDIESMPFVEAFRQLQFTLGTSSFCCVHISLIPQLHSVGEPKTKPTQISIRELRARGLQPDILMCRCISPLPSSVMDKLSNFCQLPTSHILSVYDVDNLHEVPLLLEQQNLSSLILKQFGIASDSKLLLEPKIPNCVTEKNAHFLDPWRRVVERIKSSKNGTVRISIVGKYTKLTDSYLSLIKAIQHAASYLQRSVQIDLIDAEALVSDDDAVLDDIEPVKIVGKLPTENNSSSECINRPNPKHKISDLPKNAHFVKNSNSWHVLRNCTQAVIVAGGFGQRGFEGKVAAVEYCRETGLPFLGICLGLQCAVIEFARNVLGMKEATSQEIHPDAQLPMIVNMPEFSPGQMGGTMRLGTRSTSIGISDTTLNYYNRTYKRNSNCLPGNDGHNLNGETRIEDLPVSGSGDSSAKLSISSDAISKVLDLLQSGVFYARHRHRYEVNPKYVNDLESAGLAFVGRDLETGTRMEVVEMFRPIDSVTSWQTESSNPSDDEKIKDTEELITKLTIEDGLGNCRNKPIQNGDSTRRHPFFVATQFHPEYTSRPMRPCPFFVGLIAAAVGDPVPTEPILEMAEANEHILGGIWHNTGGSQAKFAHFDNSKLQTTSINANPPEVKQYKKVINALV